MDPYSRAQLVLASRPSPYLRARHSPVRQRRRFLLGALTPDQAAEQIFPASKVSGTAGHTQAVRDLIAASAQAGQMLDPAGLPAYVPGSKDCAGVSFTKPALTGTIGSLALHFAPQAFAAGGPIAGAIVLAVAGVSELFTVIFSHHAKAVAKERSVLCAAVPAANQSIELIDQAVQQGQATPQDAMAALDAVVTGFRQAVSGIIKGSNPATSSQCNAACVMLAELGGVVALKKSVYQDMVTSTSGSIFPSFGSAATSSWLPWAIGAFVLYEVFS